MSCCLSFNMGNKRRYQEEDKKEDPGTCSYCRKSFDTLSTFLRHVTHSKLCLADHDPATIKYLKEKSRLKSKRKTFHKKSYENSKMRESKKIKLEKNKSSGEKIQPPHPPQQLYASIEMRQSDAGKVFYKIFEAVYDNVGVMVKSKLQKHAQEDEYIKTRVLDDVMDLFFNEEFDRTRTSLVISGGYDRIWSDGDARLIKTFEVLESKFDAYYAKELMEAQENWVLVTHFEMNTNLFHYSWHKALCDYYTDERFIEATKAAQDYAIDKVLGQLTTEEHFEYHEGNDDDLEAQFSKAYMAIFKLEFERFCCDFGFQTELKTFMEKKWERKFKKSHLQYHDC